MNRFVPNLLGIAFGISLLCNPALGVEWPPVEWTTQTGSSSDDCTDDLAVDASGGIYITGKTTGDMGGPNHGGRDAWFAKYDAAGSPLWAKQLGTSGTDEGFGVATDSSGIYLTGWTRGDLFGPNEGGYDAWFAKYDAGGNELWTKQFGTFTHDDGTSVATDGAGSVYLAGNTMGSMGGANAGEFDSYLARYDTNGNQLWMKQFGTSAEDHVSSVVTDASGSIYIAGHTRGDLGGTTNGGNDAWLAKYDDAGNQLWIEQFGTYGQDYCHDVITDPSGAVYLSGSTDVHLFGTNAGGNDGWFAKYDGDGNQLWGVQLGTSMDDNVRSVATDGSDTVYITGMTVGELGGPHAGNDDSYIARFDGDGNRLWLDQFGTSGGDRACRVASVGSGRFCVTGDTQGDLGGPNAGGYDAFVMSLQYQTGTLATNPGDGALLDFGLVRLGTTGTETLTATNTGSPGTALSGSLPAAEGEFDNGDTAWFGALDSGEGDGRQYTYTPTERGADAQSIEIHSDGGDSQITLSGTGVSPRYDSSAAPDSTLSFDTIEYGVPQSFFLDISNITIDANGGDDTLTDLTLLDVEIIGEDAALFDVVGFTSGTVLHKDDQFSLELSYNGTGTPGLKNAAITILTDEDAALGGDGSDYDYDIWANALGDTTGSGSVAADGSILLTLDSVNFYKVFIGDEFAQESFDFTDLLYFDGGQTAPNWICWAATPQDHVDDAVQGDENFAEITSAGNYIGSPSFPAEDYDTWVNVAPLPAGYKLWLKYGFLGEEPTFVMIDAPNVPEPGTFALSALALLGLAFCGRRRKR